MEKDLELIESGVFLGNVLDESVLYVLPQFTNASIGDYVSLQGIETYVIKTKDGWQYTRIKVKQPELPLTYTYNEPAEASKTECPSCKVKLEEEKDGE